MVSAALSDRSSPVDTTQLTNVFWISDGSTVGTGFLHVEGVDWNASYDLDLGDYGAWNTGVTGTYYLHRFVQTVSGGAIVDMFHQNIQAAGGIPQNGVETLPRMIYRARLGWSNGAFSVTGFLNYQSHFYAPFQVPPNVNFQCLAAGGSVGGGTFPCAISNYTGLQPAYTTFDLALGYDTGDAPANEYAKHVNIQLVIQNITNRLPPFEYVTASGQSPTAFDFTQSDVGRAIGLILTKSW
jgi:iron complex outermembrane receptor protein